MLPHQFGVTARFACRDAARRHGCAGQGAAVGCDSSDSTATSGGRAPRSRCCWRCWPSAVFLLELAPLELQRRIVNNAVEAQPITSIALLCGLYLDRGADAGRAEARSQCLSRLGDRNRLQEPAARAQSDGGRDVEKAGGAGGARRRDLDRRVGGGRGRRLRRSRAFPSRC